MPDELHQIQVHSRRRTEVAALGPQQEAIIKHLALPCKAAHTSYSVSPWDKHDPILPTPHSAAWTTVGPSASSGSLQATADVASSEDWDALPPFHHWSSTGLAAPSRRTPAVDISSRGNALAHSAGEERYDDEVESKDRAGVPTKGRKRVRLESPTQILRKSTMNDMDHRNSRCAEGTRDPVASKTDEDPGGPLRRSTRTRAQKGKELVPSTPAESQPQEDPDLAARAIERCIPPPYHHEVSHEFGSTSHPTRQEPTRVLHSFVDPSYSLARSTSSASLPAVKTNLDLAAVSPKTAQYLIPGRKGSWLVPVSGPFPLKETSPPTWYHQPPSVNPSTHRATSSSRSLARGSVPPAPIQWTSRRLSALWSFLSDLNASSSFGPVRAACHFSPPIPTPTTTETSRERVRGGGEPPSLLPGYIKITLDADLALAFRTLLSLVSVEIASKTTTRSSRALKKEPKCIPPKDEDLRKRDDQKRKGRKGSQEEAEEEEEENVETSLLATKAKTRGAFKERRDDNGPSKDTEKWLKGKSLVWVDESGRAVLTA